MFVICNVAAILAVLNLGPNTNLEGRLVQEKDNKYIVDFSKGITEYKLNGKPSKYKKVVIDKNECMKE
jgi:hypothetical protein